MCSRKGASRVSPHTIAKLLAPWSLHNRAAWCVVFGQQDAGHCWLSFCGPHRFHKQFLRKILIHILWNRKRKIHINKECKIEKAWTKWIPIFYFIPPFRGLSSFQTFFHQHLFFQFIFHFSEFSIFSIFAFNLINCVVTMLLLCGGRARLKRHPIQKFLNPRGHGRRGRKISFFVTFSYRPVVECELIFSAH